MSLQDALALAIHNQRAGRLAEAESIYSQILHKAPGYADALHLLGVVKYQQRDFLTAANLIQRAIILDDGLTGALHNLALALTGLEQHEQALTVIQRAAQADPYCAGIHNTLGNALLRNKRRNEAIEAFETATELNPALAEAHSNLGSAYFEAGDFDRALAAHRMAVKLNPQIASAHYNLGTSLKKLGRQDEAIAELRAAIQLDPNFIDAYTNLCAALHDTLQSDQAIAVARQAMQRQPDSLAICNTLAYLLRDTGQLDDAITSFRKALAIDPRCIWAHSGLIHTMHFHPGYDNSALSRANRQWNELHAKPLANSIVAHANDCNPHRRIRIGYVSPDFRNHCQSFFTLPLLSHHDRERFEIFCYSDLSQPDEITQRLKNNADGWRSIAGLSDQAVAQLVRQDQIDILVDLTLHMTGNRLLVFARKPAPVQVTWLAYPGSTGLDAIDYRITDANMDPPGENDRYYSEKSIQLPDSFWCYDPLSDEPPVNPIPPSMRDGQGHITFGSMNSFAKINQSVLALWASVLRAVPNSRLLTLANPGDHRRRTLDALGTLGIDPNRVEFEHPRPRPAYLDLFHRIDISLDTFPANGHTTTLDSLWMGVPVITLPGQTAISRGAMSILKTVGLTELVAENEQQYVTIACTLADDCAALRSLRETLRRRMKASPLMDAPRFARNMENAYRRMWQEWCMPNDGSSTSPHPRLPVSSVGPFTAGRGDLSSNSRARA